MKLTEEQEQVVASTSDALRVIAFAGAGKTSTLKAFSESRPSKRLVYLAFNRAIRNEAASKFPPNVKCITTHALAFHAIGKNYQHKLTQANPRAHLIAHVLGLRPQIFSDLVIAKEATKALLHFLASPCSGYDTFADVFSDTYESKVLGLGHRLWESMIDPNNSHMPMLHDGYLKLYQLSGPKLNFDGLLFDEAQDANPVTLAIVRTQEMSKVFVGDPHQQIYQFRRAENAMDDPQLSDTLYLTESFRFGKNIADAANNILSAKREKKQITGGRKRSASDSYAFIARGNAAIFTRAVALAKGGQRLFYVGGIDGYRLNLLQDICRLRAKCISEIADPFVKNFGSFDKLAEYAESQDERDLKAWVNVISRHPNWELIPSEIQLVRERSVDKMALADCSLTTAHKSKGLEFGIVELAEDFPSATLITEPGILDRVQGYPQSWEYGPGKCPLLWEKARFKGGIVLPEEEINIRYVAATRAEGSLFAGNFGNPPFRKLREYVDSHPSFVRVDDIYDLRSQKHKATSSNGKAAISESESLRDEILSDARPSEVSDTWLWGTYSKPRVDSTCGRYSANWPQWAWSWVASEAIGVKGCGDAAEKVSDFAARLGRILRLTEADPNLIQFLDECGLVTNGQNSSDSCLVAKGSDRTQFDSPVTLSDIVYMESGVRINSSDESFRTIGWASAGEMEVSCPSCERGKLDAYMRPDASGASHQASWALVCPYCETAYKPSQVEGTSHLLTDNVGARQLSTALSRSRNDTDPVGPSIFASPKDLTRGRPVTHSKFGRGVVQRTFDTHENLKVEVTFDKYGTKTLVYSLAKLHLAS